MKQKIKLPKDKIIKILKENGVKRAGIFGSYARGEQNKNSDIDILVEVPKDRKFSLLDLVRLERRLRIVLGMKVDLSTYKGINYLLKKRILKEEVKII